MIAIIDYGVGNLFSLSSSFKAIGQETVITSDKSVLKKADKIVLPGVGAFKDAIDKLSENNLDEFVKEMAAKGKPLLGICLGMQMLFEKSYEYGEHKGLGILKGEIVPMEGIIAQDLKIPHIGWNSLDIKKENRILRNIKAGDFVYFVHSYFATNCDESLVATTNYGKDLTAVVEYNNVFGCQFHPEKSGTVGLNILKAFSEDKLC